MDFIFLKTGQQIFFFVKGILMLILICSSLGCKQAVSGKHNGQHESTIQKHTLEIDLIAYIDSAAHLLNKERRSDTSLRSLTARFAKILPLNIYQDGNSSPDSTISVSIHPGGPTTDQSLDIAIPHTLENKLKFKSFTDHYGKEDWNCNIKVDI